MAYRNVLGPLGHEWIGEYDVECILRKFPESHYGVWVRFSDDKNDIPLKDCTRKERNIEFIIINYLDGTHKLDPDPYIYHVHERVSAYFIVFSGLGAIQHFAERCKRPFYKQTRNEEVADIKAMRELVRKKVVKFTHMEDFDKDPYDDRKDRDISIPINFFYPEERERVLKILENLDTDGMHAKVTLCISEATIDQLQRLDNDMEMILVCEAANEIEQE